MIMFKISRCTFRHLKRKTCLHWMKKKKGFHDIFTLVMCGTTNTLFSLTSFQAFFFFINCGVFSFKYPVLCGKKRLILFFSAAGCAGEA